MGGWEGGQIPLELEEITGFKVGGGFGFHSDGFMIPQRVTLVMRFGLCALNTARFLLALPLKSSDILRKKNEKIIITFPIRASLGDRPVLLKTDYWQLQASDSEKRGPWFAH